MTRVLARRLWIIELGFLAAIAWTAASMAGRPLPGAPQEPPPPPYDPTLEPVRTTLPVRLLGTLVAHQPEFSLASIEDLRARDWASYSVGEALGSARVL